MAVQTALPTKMSTLAPRCTRNFGTSTASHSEPARVSGADLAVSFQKTGSSFCKWPPAVLAKPVPFAIPPDFREIVVEWNPFAKS